MTDRQYHASSWREQMLPPREHRIAVLQRCSSLLSDLVDAMPGRRQQPTIGEAQIQAVLDTLDLENGDQGPDLLERCVTLLADGMAHASHPMCFGIFTPAPAFPAVVASLVTSTLNPQLSSWSSAPAAQFIERHLIKYLGELLGFPIGEVDGHFTSGGTQANHTALILALDRASPGFRDRGVRSLAGQPRIYMSEEGHHAWFKLAHASGIGREAIRVVAVDAQGRIEVGNLAQQIKLDRAAGDVPVMLVGTAGTTGTGAIDPLPTVADIAGQHNLHFHVDAAWAGAAALSRRLRPVLAGIASADSVTIDPHKWLSMPLGSGVFINRDNSALRQAFHTPGSYQPKETEYPDPHAHSLQGSRRLVGLELLLALATLGRRGYEALLEDQADLGNLLRERLTHAGWRIVNDSLLPVVCFVDPNGRDPDAIVQYVLHNGRAFISATDFLGSRVIRTAITNHQTSGREVIDLVSTLDEARNAIPASRSPSIQSGR